MNRNKHDLKKYKQSHVTVHKHHISLTLIIIIFLISLILLMVKPAFTGYRLTKDFGKLNKDTDSILNEIKSLEKDLAIKESDLKGCKSLNEQYLEEIKSERNKSFICSTMLEKKSLEINLLVDEFNFNISNLKKYYEENRSRSELELKNLQSKFKELKETYDKVIKSSADNICCKNRIDNPDIDSYIISNNRIVCTIGESNKISC